MKSFFGHKNIFAIAAALATVTNFGCVSQAEERPIPPPVAEVTLPANVSADSPAAQVIKLVRSGVDVSIISNFIFNTPDTFALDADSIITLNDAGVPTVLINQMLDHDKKISAANTANAVAAAAPPAEKVVVVNQTAPPSAPVTVNYFNDTLSPYGSWVEVDGYGRCWRPTVVSYESDWRPYCDRGHWVYTDCGWYWDSDYSWGVTFHYGRWFRHARHGWCWYPDTEWAPSWVTFRSGGDYCGWAPLPPLAVFRPGAGFFYRGASVSVGFSFGLEADCFTFVGSDRFCERRPRDYCAGRDHVTQIFNKTTVINNYGNNNTTIINNGIAVNQVSRSDHNPIRPVEVSSLPNASRQGWRGENGNHEGRRDGGNGNNNAGRNNLSNGNANGNILSGGRATSVENDGGEGKRNHGPLPVQTSQENRAARRSDANGGSASNLHPVPSKTVPVPSGNQVSTPPTLPGRAVEQQSAPQNGNGEAKRNRGPAPVLRPQNSEQRKTDRHNENSSPVVASPVVQPAMTQPVRVENQNPQRISGNNRTEAQNRESQNRARGLRNESENIRSSAPSANVIRATPPTEQARISPPVLTERTPRQNENRQNESRQNELRQNRNIEAPVFSAPILHTPQVEQRQIAAPVQRSEQRVEQRSAPVARSAPMPVVSQPRNSENNSPRNSERNSDRGNGQRFDKNKDKD